MATETSMVYTWISSTLSADSTLQSEAPGGVFESFALPGTTMPYAMAEYRNSTDYMAFGIRSHSELHFEVTVVGPFAVKATVESAAAQVDTLITVTQPTAITGGTIMSCTREDEISKDIWVDGQKCRLAGGTYKIFAKAS